MHKQINLIINGKGGIGKSFFATNIVQYLKDCGADHCAIDSDHENSTLKRFRPERSSLVSNIAAKSTACSRRRKRADLLVIDCRAASTDLFIDFFDEVGLVEVLRSLEGRLTVICLVNHEADSVEQLRTVSDALQNGCGWVVVKNEAHSETFKIYDGSKTNADSNALDSKHRTPLDRALQWHHPNMATYLKKMENPKVLNCDKGPTPLANKHKSEMDHKVSQTGDPIVPPSSKKGAKNS